MNRSVSEILAEALIESDVKVVTCVPGSGSDEILSDYNRLKNSNWPVSYHEEAAYSLAFGAALTGTRSASIMKSHGFIKAGNSVIDSLYSGTTAGLLIIICTDHTGRQSDSIFDVEPVLQGLKLVYRIADLNLIKQQVTDLIIESEKSRLPVVLLVDSQYIKNKVEDQDNAASLVCESRYQRDIVQHLLCPFFAEYQYKVLQCKRQHGDWRDIPRPELPGLPDSVPEKWRAAINDYTLLFSVFSSIRGKLVAGDTGISSLFGCPPFNCIDITDYLGGSLPLAIGAYLGGIKDVWAVTGDFAFVAAGHLGLIEARQRNIPLKVIILYNGKAETTGGQPVPSGTLESILAGYSRNILNINNPRDRSEIEKVLNQAAHSSEMQIVVADYRK